MKTTSQKLTAFFTAAYLSIAGNVAIADDTEIFFTSRTTEVRPNILFILDGSGSMDTDDVGAENEKRLDVMKRSAKSVIDSLTDANVGIMAFGSDDAGYFEAPIANIDGRKETLKAAVDAIDASGNTPLSEVLFQSMRYFEGGDIFVRSTNLSGSEVDGVTVVGAGGGKRYDSPVEYECQPNFAVLLTDGQPTSDTNYQTDTIEPVVGTCSGNCLDEVAGHMWTTDLFPASGGENVFPGDQKVSTYTVGFINNQALLSDAAAAGGGEYILAEDSDQLTAALQKIVTDVKSRSTTFVSPGIAVNTFDRLNHLNQLYYALFQSEKGAIWPGNLKRYQLTLEEDPVTGEKEAVIVDENGEAAIDQATGFFKETAQSWWSPVVDGPNVFAGGAASQLPEDVSTRKVYSNLVSNRSDLSDTENALVASNTNITKADLGNASMTDETFTKIINWVRGVDVNDIDADGSSTDARKEISDPLHSVPQLVIYDATTDPQDISIYFGDNQGFLHGIDGQTGANHFSFMPKEMLVKQQRMLEETETSDKEYGLDGTVTSWIYDDDKDGKIESADGDFVRLFTGMRRGGRSYYALDVTDRTAPTLLWTLTGGIAGTDFEELGQSWSKPVKTKVEIGSSVEEVLIFGGGYDVDQDDADVRTVDDVGRAIYIVDATSGDLLWWAGPTGSDADLVLSEMQYSIPASPKVIDVNGDGLADQIYVGDMGGQIFRIDISNGARASELATGGRIANLAGSDEANARRFYHSPDISGVDFATSARTLALVIGSGYQAHPLDEVIDDRIYMLKIDAVSSAPIDPTDPQETRVLYQTITESDLFDTTDNAIQQGTDEERVTATEALASADGWYIRLTNDGEKVLADTTTVNNEIWVSTYDPTPSANPCYPPTGKSRLYRLSLLDGSARVNYYTLDNREADDLSREDRLVAELPIGGLPPKPQRMRIEDKNIVCVGTFCDEFDAPAGVVETYWYEE